MKLNIGSGKPIGEYRDESWINLDKNPAWAGYRVTIADVTDIPFYDNTFEEIRFLHCLEHLTRHQHMPALKEIYRVLAPGGLAFVEVPDFAMTVLWLHNAFKEGDRALIHEFHTSLYGKQRHAADFHHAGFYGAQLVEMMEEAGFADVLRLVNTEDMVSTHWHIEPVLLVRGTKRNVSS